MHVCHHFGVCNHFGPHSSSPRIVTHFSTRVSSCLKAVAKLLKMMTIFLKINSQLLKIVTTFPLGGPAAILFALHDTCRDSIA